ncbi:MAG: hypothetical protein GY905_08700 [Gammaproteobacteria bacterium]|jgi:hypothetical protein|nr:hypothetical protein [Gammaproteobacteria bacterium]
MKRTTLDGVEVFHANLSAIAGSVTIDANGVVSGLEPGDSVTSVPIDIGTASGWCAQFGVNTSDAIKVQTYVSAGDTSKWAELGDLQTLEDGQMVSDDKPPYRYVKYTVTTLATGPLEVTGVVTLAIER